MQLKFNHLNFNVYELHPEFLVNDQIDAKFSSMYLFQFSTHFEQPHAHHQEDQLYQYNLWYMSQTLIQLILLVMSTRLLETCRKFK